MSIDSGYFDSLYEKRDDPWRLAERWYETRKRAITLAALPRERFGSALEVGCSIGTLTAALAPRCDRLLAIDTSQRAVDLATTRLLTEPHVSVEKAHVPKEWPAGSFDLVMLSEVGYYFSEYDLTRVVELSTASLEPDGVLVSCHWRHPVDEYPLTGDQVQQLVLRRSGLPLVASYGDGDFTLNVFSADASSVAGREGLLH